MAADLRQKLVPAVQNATAILRHLSSSGAPVGATQIARACDLNVSSTFNILRTLAVEGLVSFNPQDKTYGLGLGLLELATPLLVTSPSDVIRPLMAEIAENHRIMVATWHITDSQRIVLTDRIAAERIVQAVIADNSRLPVFAGAIGRCYAAALERDENTARAGYDMVRWQSPPGFESYWADIEKARETRFAFDRGHLFRGLEIVAAVVRDRAGAPRIGMSAITIAGQHDLDELTQAGRSLADAAHRIERGLYGRSSTQPSEDQA